MRLANSLPAALGLVAYASDQVLLTSNTGVESPPSRPWDQRLSEDATGNLVFQSLASLMQMRPNSRYPFGHSIVRGSIPPGTLLYHGRGSDAFPEADWIAFDPEHSQVFARGDNGTLFTFATTRDLKLVYFDGCSADKAEGVDDTQDILIWGKLGHDAGRGPGRGEQVRLVDACEWAKEFDVDGFIRMEMDFEIMYCDFTRGLQLVSALNIINSRPGGPGGPGGPGRKHPPGGGRDGLRRDIHNGSHIDGPPDGPSYGPGGPGGPDGPDGPDGPGRPGGPRGPGRGSPSTPPPGWKGALPNIGNAVEHAGSWHNTFPGDLRVHVDPASMLTFFDPAFTSLIPSRRALPREQYRLHNLSNIDVAQARKDIAEMFSRPAGERSGVDWLALAQTVQDRFAERLPYLRYMLHLPTQNVSAHAAAVRQQFIVSLIPYMPRAGVGEPAWFAETAQGCRASYTAHLPIWRFTKQEHVLHNAVDEVLHEVCRVLTSAWSEAFGVEDKSIDAAAELLTKWKDEVDALVGWLDWPVWMRCENSCAINEFCLIPQPRFGRNPDDAMDHTPRCVAFSPPSL